MARLAQVWIMLTTCVLCSPSHRQPALGTLSSSMLGVVILPARHPGVLRGSMASWVTH